MTTEAIILMIAVVAVVIFGFWLIQHSMYSNEEKKRRWELKRESQKTISPIRLRAYERLALLLERTKPEHMLMGLDLAHMTVPQLQQQLLQTIRQEYEHNLSQQVYVSEEVWTLLINARDQMASFVVGISAQLPPNADAMTYAKILLEAYASNGLTPTDKAMAELKEEAKSIM
ncbi:MAG: hypothetical protein J5621_06960 [Paludibacteraceae bacterium]|nr:hypothetical protein [Paludibacteraceae bacterium]